MKYSSAIPTKPGYYWFKSNKFEKPQIIEIVLYGKFLEQRYIGSDWGDSLDECVEWGNSEWMGPLYDADIMG